ncbi:hypothetical protein [Alcanivorax sp. NBRC 102028]|uniref:hypothetical protein n=1 Tax=Alcanivorax sp. NBRC 102028 TaxID=1113897 RepID=UPI000789ECD0|nr:hypothetical protein [Alcanivorax sp. NBRC 102028]
MKAKGQSRAKKWLPGTGIIGLGLMLAACGGDGMASSPADQGGAPTTDATLQGTAAVGQAIANATVTATCKDGSGFTLSPVTTDNNGKWSGQIDSDQLPCVLELSGGTPAIDLTSMAFAPGTTNISQLTQLALAMAGTDANLNWKTTVANWPTKAQVDAAVSDFVQTLKEKGYVPASLKGDPFGTPFDANGTGWDAVLDSIRELVENPSGSIDGYEELAQLLAEGNLDSLPDYDTQGDPELPANLNVLTDYAGTYTVMGSGSGDPGYCGSCGVANRDHSRGTVIITAQGDIDFDDGILLPATDIVAIYDRKNVDADRRIAVNFGESDSDERVRLYLNADLDVMEIIHDDGQGTTTRALIKEETAEPAVEASVDSADLGANSSPTQAEFLTLMTATWPVAIYQTPSSSPQWYGQGALTISGSTTNWMMELQGADGSTISSVHSSGALPGTVLTPFSETDYGFGPIYMPGHLFINQGTAITEFLNTYAEWDSGLIEGSAGGNGEVKFRNSMVAYGAAVPDVFTDLAGTWSGTASVACGGNPYVITDTVTNTMTITAQGHFTLQGQTQLCGGTFPQEMEWGGNDDFLIPGPEESDGAYLMHIDAQDFANVSAGKIQIRFNDDMTVKSLSAWVNGELFEMKNATRQ